MKGFKPTTYLSTLGGGLGDIVCSLPIIRALLRTDQLILVMRTPRQEGFDRIIPGLTAIRESDLEQTRLEKKQRYINLRNHPLQTDYYWGSPEFERDYPAFRINDILRTICRDYFIDGADFEKLVPLNFETRTELADTIVCIPGTTSDAKTWSAKNWLALAQMISSTGQGSVVMIGQPEHSQIVRELQENNFPLLATPDLKAATDVLSSAKAVVSVDTGLMHLAVNQGTPTVCLFQDPIYSRPYPNAFNLQSKQCAKLCTEARIEKKPQLQVNGSEWVWQNFDFNFCLVPEADRCINSITVEEVIGCLNIGCLVGHRP